MPMLKPLSTILTLALVTMLSGCSAMMHELQPHRLWRWNYHPAPATSSDILFCIDDPVIPQTTPPAEKVTDEVPGRSQVPALPAHE